MQHSFVNIGDSRVNPDRSVSTLVDNGDGTLGVHTVNCPTPEYPLTFDPKTGVIGGGPANEVTFARIALDVLETAKPSKQYVSLYVGQDRNGASEYIIWTTVNGFMRDERLLCSVTSRARLLAHVIGFMDNVKGQTA